MTKKTIEVRQRTYDRFQNVREEYNDPNLPELTETMMLESLLDEWHRESHYGTQIREARYLAERTLEDWEYLHDRERFATCAQILDRLPEVDGDD